MVGVQRATPSGALRRERNAICFKTEQRVRKATAFRGRANTTALPCKRSSDIKPQKRSGGTFLTGGVPLPAGSTCGHYKLFTIATRKQFAKAGKPRSYSVLLTHVTPTQFAKAGCPRWQFVLFTHVIPTQFAKVYFVSFVREFRSLHLNQNYYRQVINIA